MNKKNKIYEKESYRKNSEIEKIDDNFILKTDILGNIKKYLKIIIISLILFTVFLFILSIPVLPMYLMTIILFVCVIFFNSYKLKASKGKISIIQDTQEVVLNYTQIKNVYIERYVTKILFKKIYSYSIVIIYETIKGKVLDITLPTLFLKHEQIEKFLNHFTVKKSKKNYIQMAKKNKMRRKFIRALLFLLFLILITITYIVQK